MTTRSLSLIEQKRLQWSREREEMSKFYGLWAPTTYQMHHRKISDSYLSQLGLNKLHEVFDLEDLCGENRCLPPIQKSLFNEDNRLHNDSRSNAECNTSGYGSETDTRDLLPVETKKKQWRSQSSLCSDTAGTISSQGFSDDMTGRLKWGDRGVGIGHLWEPTTNNMDARLPEINNRPGTPHWLQRSLLNKNHLRGQNVNPEPETIIQREQKRKKALELQEAIKQQLQEKERKRKEDKEQQIEEEKKLEQRLKKQQEIERIRIEEERKRQIEKEEMENKKAKAMREALVAAEQLAKEAKTKTKYKVLSEIHPKLDTNINVEDYKKQSQISNKNEKENEENNLLNGVITEGQKERSMCDAHTSLTPQKYFEEFKITIPLVSSQWTQTNSCYPISKTRKKIPKSGERPKWGVNRPNTKYLKQSEKDPFYHRKIKYHSHRRCQFEQEPSGSSRSFDSTDESKSVSSSPREKDFNMNVKLNLRKKFSPLNDKVDAAAVNYDSDKSQDNENIPLFEIDDFSENMPNSGTADKVVHNSTNSKELALQNPSTIPNNLYRKRNYWEDEMEQISTEFSEITLETK